MDQPLPTVLGNDDPGAVAWDRLARSSGELGRSAICRPWRHAVGLADPVCAEMIEAPLLQRSRAVVGPILRAALPLDAAETFADLLDRIDRQRARGAQSPGQFSSFLTED